MIFEKLYSQKVCFVDFLGLVSFGRNFVLLSSNQIRKWKSLLLRSNEDILCKFQKNQNPANSDVIQLK